MLWWVNFPHFLFTLKLTSGPELFSGHQMKLPTYFCILSFSKKQRVRNNYGRQTMQYASSSQASWISLCVASEDLNFSMSKMRGAPTNQLLTTVGPSISSFVYLHHCQVGRKKGLGAGCVREHLWEHRWEIYTYICMGIIYFKYKG